MLLITMKCDSMIFRLISYEVVPSRNPPDPVEHNPSMLPNSLSLLFKMLECDDGLLKYGFKLSNLLFY